MFQVASSNHTIYKPSVLEVLNATRSPESTENLTRWEDNNIRKLGVEGFREFSKGEFFTTFLFVFCLELFCFNDLFIHMLF